MTLSEFDHRCAYCSKHLAPGDTHRDHFVPFARGGADDASNIVPACGDCNRAKRDQMPDAWLARCRSSGRQVNPKLKEWIRRAGDAPAGESFSSDEARAPRTSGDALAQYLRDVHSLMAEGMSQAEAIAAIMGATD